jgi:hypothetical protein
MNRQDILDALFGQLWQQYKQRVSYAASYQKMVEERGGRVLNDHIAFRTLNCPTGSQPAGVPSMERIFLALGYVKKDHYLFADKYLLAWHYEHSGNPENPKLFISQLEVDKFSVAAAEQIKKSVAQTPDLLSSADQQALTTLATGKDLDDAAGKNLAASLVKYFSRPWQPPQRHIVESVDKETQYGAWVLLHGNAVNHFTAYINHQNVKEWADLEATVTALRAAGLPMKDEFEGEKGSKLRQSSTKASMEECDVTEADGSKGQIKWSYAYYELAERGNVPGPDGKPVRFQGFLGAQATNLFDMTKRTGS